jgi:IS5 family transposase
LNEIIAWKELSKVIEPDYPKPKGSGRRPIGIERMLRIHFMQHGFNLSDPAMEEALYDIQTLHEFSHINLGREPASDETTICKFRHILDSNDLGERLFHPVNEYLVENRLFAS